MTVNRTTLLDLPLPVTGTESGTWGDTTNNGLTQYLDIAIAGTLVLSTDADVTLTSTEGDSSATNIGATTAQYAILRWTATGSTTRNITALAQSKTYVVINATGGTQSIVLRGAGPTTGVTIISGEKALCVWNGSDFVKVSSSAAAGGSNTQVQYNSSGVLAGSSNLTFDGTSLTLGGNPTLSAGTANGVLYLNGSKVATSGSALTFDGTNLTLGANKIIVKNATGDSQGLQIYQAASDVSSIFNYYNSAIAFGVNNTEQMRLTSTGLGIGTNSPGAKLQVAWSSDQLKFTNPSAGFKQIGASYTGYVSGNDYAAIILGTDGSSGGKIQFSVTPSSGSLTTAATLDQNGNLGLGVTPSAWSQGTALEMYQIGYGFWNGSGNPSSIYMLANTYYNSGFKYANTGGYASSYYQYNGQHVWSTAPSGTAGNAITFTQAMTLDASGNLGIGTTSPTRRLDVYGSGQFKDASGIGTTIWSEAVSGAGGTGTNTNHPFAILTNGTERARITSGGYFKASDNGAYLGSGSGYHEMRSTASEYITRFTNTNAGPIGVNIYYTAAAPNGTGNRFVVCEDNAAIRTEIRSNGGLANYQSNNVDLSDARTKNSITPAASMWDKIGALEIVTYKYNDQTHDDINIGVIAQQVESVEPVWVDADGFGKTPEDGVPLKTVYTKDITFAAIKALQEAMARIETLEAKVSALEGN